MACKEIRIAEETIRTERDGSHIQKVKDLEKINIDFAAVNDAT